MLKIDPKKIEFPKLHGLMLGAIAPRPIAFVSTIDAEGRVNLAPFSFFNAFGANPPTLIFSPARSGRTNQNKHTFHNVNDVPEVVINMVSYEMVQQMSLASSEYPTQVNEFVKAGFTELPSEMVKPPRVKQSKVQIECKVKEVIETGNQGGAGNLIICEILMMHVVEHALDDNGQIDPHKLDLVGRMGANYYCRASGEAVFKVKKPGTKLGIGFDRLPECILKSMVLTGNELALLAGIEKLPGKDQITKIKNNPEYANWEERLKNDPESFEHRLHLRAKELIAQDRIEEAWCVLL